MMFTPDDYKLNRSCSESDLSKVNFDLFGQVGFEKKISLVRKRAFFVEEIIHGTDSRSHGLLRSASFNLVAGQDTPDQLYNLQSFFSTSLVLNNSCNECDISSLSLGTRLSTPNVSTNYMKNDGVLPMEVDVSQNSLTATDRVDFVEVMDVDYDPDSFINLDGVKLKKRRAFPDLPHTQECPGEPNKTRIVPVTLKRKPFKHNHIVIILLLCSALILSYILFLKCGIDIMLSVNSDIQLQNIRNDLLEKVHKQKASVNVIVQSLEEREHWENKIKVLGFIGPAGVGKSFIANIIKKHFHQALTHEIHGIQLNYKSQWEQVLSAINSCCLNLIVIDDLKRRDVTDVFALVHSLPRDQFILVISIFNIQYYDGKNYTNKFNYITEIRNEFDSSGVYHELVIFQKFHADEVKDWVEKQLQMNEVDYSLQKEIMKNVLEGHIAEYHGLKGLYPKILMELEKNNH